MGLDNHYKNLLTIVEAIEKIDNCRNLKSAVRTLYRAAIYNFPFEVGDKVVITKPIPIEKTSGWFPYYERCLYVNSVGTVLKRSINTVVKDKHKQFYATVEFKWESHAAWDLGHASFSIPIYYLEKYSEETIESGV